MSARGLIIGAPRSGSGKTSVTIGLLRALRAARPRGARRQVRPGLHRSRLPRRRHRPARRQSRQLGDAPIPARPALPMQAAAAPTSSSSKARWACSTASPAPADPARRPISRGCYRPAGRCWCSTSRASRRRRRRSPRASPPTIRRCAIAGVVLNRVASERHRRLAARGDRGDRPAGGRRDPARPDAGAARAASRPGAGRRTCRARSLHRAAGRRHGALARSRRDPDAGRAVRHRRRRFRRMPCRRPASASRSPRMPPSPSSIRMSRLHWRAAGAEMVPFSPLADEPPPDNCDACWLPGGYPGTACRTLAAAARFPRRHAAFRARHGRSMASAAASWCSGEAWRMPTETHAMLGLLGHATSFAKRRMNLGYRQARLAADCPLGRGRRRRSAATNSTMRSMVDAGDDEPLADTRRRPGPAARRVRRPARQRHRHLLPRHRQGLNQMAEQLTPNRIGADIAACLGFFTRLPAARLGFGEANFAEALWAAPVAGAIVGAPRRHRLCDR